MSGDRPQELLKDLRAAPLATNIDHGFMLDLSKRSGLQDCVAQPV
jgi:hypothetical protein